MRHYCIHFYVQCRIHTVCIIHSTLSVTYTDNVHVQLYIMCTYTFAFLNAPQHRLARLGIYQYNAMYMKYFCVHFGYAILYVYFAHL